jgi:hypothetical protein
MQEHKRERKKDMGSRGVLSKIGEIGGVLVLVVRPMTASLTSPHSRIFNRNCTRENKDKVKPGEDLNLN